MSNAQGVIKLFGTAMDITERKQAEALLNQKNERERLTMAVAQHIRQSLHLDEILATTVREVRQLLQADRVSVFRLCPDGFWSGSCRGDFSRTALNFERGVS